ncbi:hypothetical protein [Granulicella aggregans]|uniref:hypothetical protein n=1 Tax=Granulicella aggregans TaxID=474949 RepID=UPI0021E0E845|nr:hypothetical protein [Granulicella aggregans]
MASRIDPLLVQLEKDRSELARTQFEQEAIEAQPTHLGFGDATRRIKLVYEEDALAERIHKDRERLADANLLPPPGK